MVRMTPDSPPPVYDAFLGIDPGKKFGLLAMNRDGEVQWTAKPTKKDGGEWEECETLIRQFFSAYKSARDKRLRRRSNPMALPDYRVLVVCELWINRGQNRNIWNNGRWHSDLDHLLRSLGIPKDELPIMRPGPSEWKGACGIPNNYGEKETVVKTSGKVIPGYPAVMRSHHLAGQDELTSTWTPDLFAAWGLAEFGRRSSIGLPNRDLITLPSTPKGSIR